MGLLLGIEITQMLSHPIFSGDGPISDGPSLLNSLHPLERAALALILPAVRLVLRTCGDPQIVPPVVSGIEVLVVNLTLWPLPGHVEPDQSR